MYHHFKWFAIFKKEPTNLTIFHQQKMPHSIQPGGQKMCFLRPTKNTCKHEKKHSNKKTKEKGSNHRLFKPNKKQQVVHHSVAKANVNGSALNLNATKLAMFYWSPWALPADSSPNLCGRWTSKHPLNSRVEASPCRNSRNNKSVKTCLFTVFVDSKTCDLRIKNENWKYNIMMQTTNQLLTFLSMFGCSCLHPGGGQQIFQSYIFSGDYFKGKIHVEQGQMWSKHSWDTSFRCWSSKKTSTYIHRSSCFANPELLTANA